MTDVTFKGSTKCGTFRQLGTQFRLSYPSPQSRIPLLEFPPRRVIKDSRSNLKQEMRAGLRPLHLMAFAKALAGYRIDDTLRKHYTLADDDLEHIDRRRAENRLSFDL